MSVAFTRDTDFGRLVGVALPDEGDLPSIDALVAALAPDEQAFARGLAPARRATWAGGRLALRAALADLGMPGLGAILATPRGAPALPEGVTGSISHKRTLAVALAARAASGSTIGVDLELDRASRFDIAGRVLGAGERARVDAIASPAARAREVLVAFSAKEAVYKALDPWLRRHVAFVEVEVTRTAGGTLAARFSPRAGEDAFALEIAEVPDPAAGTLMTVARATRI